MPVCLINPLPHTDAFKRLCSRQLFENMASKIEIAQNKQFLPLLTCFQLYSNINNFFRLCFQSRLLQICCMLESVNTFSSGFLCPELNTKTFSSDIVNKPTSTSYKLPSNTAEYLFQRYFYFRPCSYGSTLQTKVRFLASSQGVYEV